MKKLIAGLTLFSLLLPAAGLAQEAAKPAPAAKPEDRPPLTPLRVQVVFSEFDGDKKIVNLPYTFVVNADERRARPETKIRDGARVPVLSTRDQFSYLDVGTNVDCSASVQEDGRYKLQISLERSSLGQDTSAASGNPVVRQFRLEINPVLKDGQSIETVAATDPLTGHVYHVSVTLSVLK